MLLAMFGYYDEGIKKCSLASPKEAPIAVMFRDNVNRLAASLSSLERATSRIGSFTHGFSEKEREMREEDSRIGFKWGP